MSCECKQHIINALQGFSKIIYNSVCLLVAQFTVERVMSYECYATASNVKSERKKG